MPVGYEKKNYLCLQKSVSMDVFFCRELMPAAEDIWVSLIK